MMQAYKLKVIVNESGNLILDEPLNIAPGEDIIRDKQYGKSQSCSSCQQYTNG